MWCTRWFLPLLLLPIPTAPPYFLVLFLLTLALHAKPCFYCIVLLAALFLSSCYWQSFPLDAHLSVPWADNITTFSEALNATIPSYLSSIHSVPHTVRVADRCWCDFASGLFEPYDVQKWERDSVQRAVAHIEKQWKQSLEPDEIATPNVTATPDTAHLDSQSDHTPTSLSSLLRSFFSARSIKSVPPTSPSPVAETSPPPPPETPPELAPAPSMPSDPSLAPGQLDMRPFGFELIFDFRWSTRS